MARRGFHEAGEKPRRFYKIVGTAEADGGFEVTLDGRCPRSARGARLCLPTKALAGLCAEEWASQEEHIAFDPMRATRLAYTALEAIPTAREATADQFVDYAGSDLICYFAEAPARLVDRQTAQWGPVLDRADLELGLVFLRARGILHQEQPQETLAKVRELALEGADFALAGLAFGAALYGSAVLTLALRRGWLTGAEALSLARLDEIYQEEQWGIDEEAAERTARLVIESSMLERWFRAIS